MPPQFEESLQEQAARQVIHAPERGEHRVRAGNDEGSRQAEEVVKRIVGFDHTGFAGREEDEPAADRSYPVQDPRHRQHAPVRLGSAEEAGPERLLEINRVDLALWRKLVQEAAIPLE